MDVKKEILYYYCVALTGMLATIVVQVFEIYSAPVFLFIIFLYALFAIDKYKIKRRISYSILFLIIALMGFTLYIILNVVSPLEYVFTLPIFYILVIYLIDRKTKTLLWQALVNSSLVLLLLLKPGYVLLTFMHYQRGLIALGVV